jgi:hypothetical protein
MKARTIVPAAAGGVGKAEKPCSRSNSAAGISGTGAAARKRASELDAVERKQIMATGAWQNLHDRDTGKPGASAAQACAAGF